MVTYFYWAAVLSVCALLMYFLGTRMQHWKVATGMSLLAFLVAFSAYHFQFENIFVKRWGGSMSIKVPEGQQHIAVTWKDDNLWVENYDPATNRCIFREYSKGDLLEGQVIIKNCNPLRQSTSQ